MKQSLLYFVVAFMCAASAITSTLAGHVSVFTLLSIFLAALVLGLGFRSRNLGN